MADVRRYLMPVRPFTMAMRVVHSARYGADGSDPRLLSSYLGSSYFVRGHRQDLRYCRPDATRVCGDDLLGNRLLVGNLEVRFPIWGLLSRQIEYGMFPIDAFMFADGGMIRSGSGNREPGSRSDDDQQSIGGGIRVNAGGLPLEVGGDPRARRPASALAVRSRLPRRLLEPPDQTQIGTMQYDGVNSVDCIVSDMAVALTPTTNARSPAVRAARARPWRCASSPRRRG